MFIKSFKHTIFDLKIKNIDSFQSNIILYKAAKERRRTTIKSHTFHILWMENFEKTLFIIVQEVIVRLAVH